MEIEIPRPVISDYQDPAEYIGAMINYRKKTEKHFSVLSATKHLRKISPTLISLIIQKKRNITLDRVEELAKLLHLSSSEKVFLRDWITRLENPEQVQKISVPNSERRETSVHLLSDWMNVYVKDCFQLKSVQNQPEKIYEKLASIASPQRIDKSIEFLLREGYLRKTEKGKIVTETNLTVTDPRVPSEKIRSFHKAALTIAKNAIDLYGPQERLANSLLVPLDHDGYQKLLQLTQEFAEKLQEFAATQTSYGDRIYQVLINLSPTGGKHE